MAGNGIPLVARRLREILTQKKSQSARTVSEYDGDAAQFVDKEQVSTAFSRLFLLSARFSYTFHLSTSFPRSFFRILLLWWTRLQRPEREKEEENQLWMES